MSFRVNHDWECTRGHLFEAVADYETRRLRCRVGRCRCLAERAPQPKSRRRASLPSTVFYLNEKTGEKWVPGRNTDHLPAWKLRQLEARGLKRMEISSFREYEKLSKKMNAISKREHEAYLASETEYKSRMLDAEISQLKRGYTEHVRDKNGNIIKSVTIPPLDKMNPRARAFAEAAIKRLEQAPSNSHAASRYDPGFFIESYENDNPSWNDRETNFRKRVV